MGPRMSDNGTKSITIPKYFFQILVTLEITHLATSVWQRAGVMWPTIEQGQGPRQGDIEFFRLG